MSLYGDQPQQEAQPLPPCAACGAPAPFVVWEHRLCPECSGQWEQDMPTGGEVDARLGIAITDRDGWKKSSAEFLWLTREWVAARKRVRRIA